MKGGKREKKEGKKRGERGFKSFKGGVVIKKKLIGGGSLRDGGLGTAT